MSPRDDHELLLWSMRAGLTRVEVRQTLWSVDTGDLPWSGAKDSAGT